MNLLVDAWLEQQLADGSRRASEVSEEAEAAGFGRGALTRARSRLGVHLHRRGFGPGSHVEWSLPPGNEHTVTPT